METGATAAEGIEGAVGEPKTKRTRQHVLPAELLESITPDDLAAFVASAGWSSHACRWLAHETPLVDALVFLAIGEHRSPREVLDQIVRWKRDEEARRESEELSPKPPKTKRSRRW